MKLAQAILEEKEEVVRKMEKKAPLYGLTHAERLKQFRKKTSPAIYWRYFGRSLMGSVKY